LEHVFGVAVKMALPRKSLIVDWRGNFMNINNSVLVGGILSLLFLTSLLAQMIHHKITGNLIIADVSDMGGFMGKWVVIGYLLDMAVVALFARYIIKRKQVKNQ